MASKFGKVTRFMQWLSDKVIPPLVVFAVVCLCGSLITLRVLAENVKDQKGAIALHETRLDTISAAVPERRLAALETGQAALNTEQKAITQAVTALDKTLAVMAANEKHKSEKIDELIRAVRRSTP